MLSPLDILALETWILLATVLVLVWFYVHQKLQFLKKLNIPHHPPSIRKLGTIGYIFDNPKQFFLKDLEMKRKFGTVYGTYTGWAPRIVISDPDILKQIMIKEFNIFYDRQKSLLKISGEVLNNGLTNISGNKWRRVRHTMSPLFSTVKLRSMMRVLDTCADVMVDNLSTSCKENNGVFDSKGVFGKFALDAICSAAFGVNVNSQAKDGDESKAIKMAKKLFQADFLTNPLMFVFAIFPWSEKIAELMNYSFFPKDSIEYFRSLTETLIKTGKTTDSKQVQSIMQIMAESEITDKEALGKTKGMTRLELIGNGVLMILAGYETTSSAINFLAYNLAWDREAQQKVREEIQGIVGEDNSLTYEAISDLKFLTQCIYESVRLYPPALRNSRFCEKEITINGVTIPKGVHIDIPIYGMARDPEYWEEPEQFMPERMEDMSKIDPIIFQPFGAGPRNCVGMRFALMEVRLAICKLLLNFEIDVCTDTPEPPIEIIMQSTSMRPKIDILHLKATPLKETS